jgi:hypothetical protein
MTISRIWRVLTMFCVYSLILLNLCWIRQFVRFNVLDLLGDIHDCWLFVLLSSIVWLVNPQLIHLWRYKEFQASYIIDDILNCAIL